MPPIDRVVGIVGYGSQGAAWAANLADSGIQTRVVLRAGSPSAAAARAAGHVVIEPGQAAAHCQVLAVLAPDAAHAAICEALGPLVPGHALVFAHGYSVHYGLVRPPPPVDVILVAPKGIGPAVRAKYLAGGGVPALIGVAQDPSSRAWSIAQEIARALGCGRAGIFRSSFREETEADLFSEQALLVGGVPALVRAAFDLLVARGTSPHVAYFECLEELKLIVDMMVALGVRGMLGKVSDNAKLGAALAGPRVVDDHMRATLEAIYQDVVSGRFHQRAQEEAARGNPAIGAYLADWERSALDSAGRGIRERAAPAPGLDRAAPATRERSEARARGREGEAGL